MEIRVSHLHAGLPKGMRTEELEPGGGRGRGSGATEGVGQGWGHAAVCDSRQKPEGFDRTKQDTKKSRR